MMTTEPLEGQFRGMNNGGSSVRQRRILGRVIGVTLGTKSLAEHVNTLAGQGLKVMIVKVYGNGTRAMILLAP